MWFVVIFFCLFGIFDIIVCVAGIYDANAIQGDYVAEKTSTLRPPSKISEKSIGCTVALVCCSAFVGNFGIGRGSCVDWFCLGWLSLSN